MTTKERLIKRLEWYYPTEKFNAFLILGIMVYVSITYPIKEIVLLLYGLLLMTIILFQGQHYWKLKLLCLKKKAFDQHKNLQFFRKSKKINIIMIGLIPLFVIIQLLLKDWSLSNSKLFWFGLAANFVGLLEHINYYHRQLMIDNVFDLKYLVRNKQLKVASLRKDLDENVI